MILAAHLAARWLDAAPEVVWVVTCVVSFHVFSRLSNLLVLGFQARQEMAPVAAVQVAPGIVILLLGGLAMLQGAGVGVTMASMPLGALLTLAAISLFATRRFGRLRLRLRRAEITHYLRQGLPAFYVIALSALYARLGIVYVTVLAGEAEAGLFASAERLVVAAGLACVMFSTALFPVIAGLWPHERERFTELVQRAARLVLFFTLPVATLLALFAQDIVPILFGDDFTSAAVVLVTVAWLLVVRGMAQLLSTTSLAADRQRALLISKALGLALLTLGCFSLVPTYGAIGLAAVMLVSELCAAALNYELLQRSGLKVIAMSAGLRVALACLLAASLAWLAADLALWLRGLVVTAGGLLALWGFGAIRSNDMAYLRTILNSTNTTSN
jgi:O-antigen/teichoic acid export membrane protein